MKKHKKFCAVFAVLCIIAETASVAQAEEVWPAEPEIAGDAAIVMEAESGVVLYEKNAHQQHYPASITKIMTGLLALENSSMDELVTFSSDSVFKTEGSGIWRDVDEVMNMEQCMYAMLLNSANECAYAIAEHVGGSYDQFIGMMNDKAVQLGCRETHFCNPNGLPDESHYTSCYDMALIASAAIQNEGFRTIVGTTNYVIPPTNKHPDENTYLSNHHKMLQKNTKYSYESCIGGKTGYTVAAGNTLVTYAQKDGMLLVCVVMNEQTPNHYLDTRALLDYCFGSFRIWNVKENETCGWKEDSADASFPIDQDYTILDCNDNIILPLHAAFEDAAVTPAAGGKSQGAVSSLQYTYAGKSVGTADILFAGQHMDFFPCTREKNAGAKETGQGQAKEKPFHFLPYGIGIAGIVIAAGAVLTGARYYKKKQDDND